MSLLLLYWLDLRTNLSFVTGYVKGRNDVMVEGLPYFITEQLFYYFVNFYDSVWDDPFKIIHVIYVCSN